MEHQSRSVQENLRLSLQPLSQGPFLLHVGCLRLSTPLPHPYLSQSQVIALRRPPLYLSALATGERMLSWLIVGLGCWSPAGLRGCLRFPEQAGKGHDLAQASSGTLTQPHRNLTKGHHSRKRKGDHRARPAWETNQEKPRAMRHQRPSPRQMGGRLGHHLWGNPRMKSYNDDSRRSSKRN